MKKNIFFCLVIMVVTASCSVSKTVSSAHTLLPKTDIIIADLDIQTSKVTGEYRYDIQLDQEKFVNKQDLVNNAIYNALHPLKADVLVGAQHRIEQSSRGNRMYYIVTVTGYPACYRNFRSSSVKDLEFKEINGSVYVIPKNANGEPAGYQVVVPSDKCSNILDVNLISLDKMLLDVNTQSILGTTGVVEDKSSNLSEDKPIRMSSLDMLKWMYNNKKSKKEK